MAEDGLFFKEISIWCISSQCLFKKTIIISKQFLQANSAIIPLLSETSHDKALGCIPVFTLQTQKSAVG